MKYSGGIRLALETRVNLLKLQSAADEVGSNINNTDIKFPLNEYE